MRLVLVFSFIFSCLNAFAQAVETGRTRCGFVDADLAVDFGDPKVPGHLRLRLKNYRTVLDNAGSARTVNFKITDNTVGTVEFVDAAGTAYHVNPNLPGAKSECEVQVQRTEGEELAVSLSCSNLAPVMGLSLDQKFQNRVANTRLNAPGHCVPVK